MHCMRLIMANFESNDCLLGKDAISGQECGDGTVKGETVLVWRAWGIANECAGVLVIFDGGWEGVVNAQRNIGRISGNDVKRRLGIETVEQAGVVYVPQERGEHVLAVSFDIEGWLLVVVVLALFWIAVQLRGFGLGGGSEIAGDGGGDGGVAWACGRL